MVGGGVRVLRGKGILHVKAGSDEAFIKGFLRSQRVCWQREILEGKGQGHVWCHAVRVNGE